MNERIDEPETSYIVWARYETEMYEGQLVKTCLIFRSKILIISL
ncbi:MAG: hypothetical protein ACI86M_000872 [Saprospiraceae bacterium]|jgi:hypothetical protein